MHDETIHFPWSEGGFELQYTACSPVQGQDWLGQIARATDWTRPEVRLYGNTHQIPRMTAFHGARPYRYSGLDNPSQPFTPVLEGIRNRVEQATGYRFNSVLLNLYRDGHDCMGWHADDEISLGPAPVIATLSLGACRLLRIRHRTKSWARLEVPLVHGSLFIMRPGMQQYWLHSIPRQLRVTQPRISLTFRNIQC